MKRAEDKEKEMLCIVVSRNSHMIVREGGGERQIDQTTELTPPTAADTNQNTVRNPISIIVNEGERIMIYTTTIIPLPIGREEVIL